MTGATIRMKSCQVLKMVYIIIIKILKNQPYKKKKSDVKVDFLFFLLQMVLLF